MFEIETIIQESYEMIIESTSFTYDPLLAIQKELDRALIKTFWAPAKKNTIKTILSDFDKEVQKIATETKSTLSNIASQLDSEMKGQFSKSVQEKFSTENKKWDEL